MSYIQAWGVSRSQSPFNTFQSPVSYMGTKKKKEVKKEEEELVPEVDVSSEAKEDIITQNNEKATTEKRGFLDRFQDALTLGGFAPGPIGAGIDLLNTAVSGGRSISSLIQGDTEGAKKHGMNALLYGLSSVPGAGDAFAAANLAKKGTKFVKEGSLAYRGAKTIGIGEGIISAESIARKDLGVDTSLQDPNLIKPAVFKPGAGRGMNRA
jgi:hypothetical protein